VSNPYKIANLENLAWLMYNDSEWDAYYVQTADIDASATKTWSNGEGFQPIGKDTIYFTGNYYGKGFGINQLNINRKDSLIGLFGIIGEDAKIQDLGLTNMSIKGGRYVGGIVGLNNGGKIERCFTTGLCEGSNSNLGWGAIGGVVGYNAGYVKYSYSNASIQSTYDVVGGLAGLNAGYISCSYSSGVVKARTYVGGLVGFNYYILYHSYSRSIIQGFDYIGGLVGYGDPYYVLSGFWDKEISGQSLSYGGEGLTTVLMKGPNDYVKADWDFMDETDNGTANIWGLNSNKNEGYPFLWWQGFENTETVTSVIDILNDESVTIYPNPVYDKLHVQLKDQRETKVVISDLRGQKIFTKEFDSLLEIIDMLEFKPGIYIVTIYAGDDIYSKKIIKS
jgi:hypothetical protein